MGAIIKRGTKDKPRFYLRYVDADGRRKMKAAKGAINVAQARRQLAEIERSVFNGNLGIPEPTAEQLAQAQITVEQLGAKFTTEYSAPKLKNPTHYRSQAKSILKVRVYPAFKDRPAASVTALEVEQLRDKLSAEDYAPYSIVGTLSTLSRMFVWGRKQGHINCANPVQGCERPRAQASLDYFSKEEVGNLLAHAEEHASDLHPMIATAIYTGMRKGELYGLRWRDVHQEANRIDVMRSYTLAPKSGKARHLPMHPELARILKQWRERCPKTDDGLVFPVDDGEGPRMGTNFDTRGFDDVLRGAECHVPEKAWHCTRHTFASHFMMSGGNILTLQKLLGHSTLTMTLVYAHLARDFMAAEVARISFARPPLAGVVDLGEKRREQAAEVDTNLTRNGHAEGEVPTTGTPKTLGVHDHKSERATGFEPATSSLED